MGGRAFHVRRRLSAVEQRQVGPAVDIRRTPEAWQRALAVEDRLHMAHPEVLADELGAG
jgi:hypothetical protein